MSPQLEKPFNSDCPKCNTSQAYTSFMHTDCVNETCENFSESHLQVVVDYESMLESLATVHKEKNQWIKREPVDEELDEFTAFYDSWTKVFFP